VSLEDVPIRGAGRLTLPSSGRALAMGIDGPLLAQVDLAEAGTSHVAAAFDVRDSRWPLSWSFQVFMVNVLDVLGGGGSNAATWHTPGRPIGVAVAVADPDLEQVRYVGDDGSLSGPVRAGRATLPGPDRAGWWEATDATASAVGVSDQRLAVNLLDAVESDPRPVDVLPVAGSLSGGTGGVAGSEQVRREWWAWVLAAALVMLCVEWVVYVRRVRV
jgi:hypothetical protein